MKKLLLIGAALLGLIGLAVAQVPGLPAVWTGNELIRLTTVAGSTGNTTYNHLRNSVGYSVTTATGAATFTANNQTSMLIVNSAPTTLAVSLPNSAYDGQNFCVSNATAAALTTNVTVTAPVGIQTQTLAVAYASQTLAANGGRACWLFAATNATGSTGTWYRSL